LVGDNGQKDMEVYLQIVENFHKRIKGVMIRKLSYIKNERKVMQFEQNMKEFKVPFKSFQ